MVNTQTAYRLVEVKDGRPYTLFHGIPQVRSGYLRSLRELPLDEWIKAEKKLVTDGTSKSTYVSGFNVLLTLDGLKDYRRRFRKPRDIRIAKVLVNLQLRPKQHSRSGVWLADWMKIPKNWEVKDVG